MDPASHGFRPCPESRCRGYPPTGFMTRVVIGSVDSKATPHRSCLLRVNSARTTQLLSIGSLPTNARYAGLNCAGQGHGLSKLKSTFDANYLF